MIIDDSEVEDGDEEDATDETEDEEELFEKDKTVAKRAAAMEGKEQLAKSKKNTRREMIQDAVTAVMNNDLFEDTDPDANAELVDIDTITSDRPEACRTWDYREEKCFNCYKDFIISSNGKICYEVNSAIDKRYLSGCRQLKSDTEKTCLECSLGFKAQRTSDDFHDFVCVKVNVSKIEHNQDYSVSTVSPNNLLISWDIAIDSTAAFNNAYKKYGSLLGEGAFVTKERVGCSSTDKNDEGKCTCERGYRFDSATNDCIPVGFSDQNVGKCLEYKPYTNVCRLCGSGYLYNGKCQGSISKSCSMGCRSCYKEPPLYSMCGNDSTEKCLICDQGWCPSNTANGMICTKCEQDDTFLIENCLFHDNRKMALKAEEMELTNVSDSDATEEIQRKLKRSVFSCYMCKLGYVYIKNENRCAKIEDFESTSEQLTSSNLCRVAKDGEEAINGMCSVCYKNATRNSAKMCVAVVNNPDIESFKQKLRKAGKIACDNNQDQSMDSEREDIGKRDDESELYGLGDMSNFEVKRLKYQKLLKQKPDGNANFFTNLKPGQNNLYFDDNF